MLVWVNLTTFDKISPCFTIKNRWTTRAKTQKNTEFCCDLSRSVGICRDLSGFVGICRDLSGFVGLLHSWTCPRQIPTNPDRSRQIPTDRDKSQQDSVVFCVFARVVHLFLIVKHGEILSKVVKLTQTNMENMLIHLKNKPNYTSKHVKKQHAKIPDKSLTQNLCKKNKTIFSRWILLIFEPAKSCYMFHSLGQEEWLYILDLWCFVVFHSSVWNIIHYFTCLVESCKYMYESPLTMMNSLHKHAVIQIEKIQHSSAHHSLISANTMM